MMKKAINQILLLCICILSVRALDKPEITGKTAITIDVDTGDIIFAKDMDRRMYPASTTKLITAVMLAQNRSREDILTYSVRAKAEVPYKLFIPAGSWMRAGYAMDALLIHSANDIAYMIAENIDSTIEQFSLRMNNYVHQGLDLKHTHFVNPSGLHSNNHYSTAYELSVIARELYTYPWIMETLGKKRSELYINDYQGIDLNSRNKLVLENKCTGGKTGWTPEAQHCLVAFFERDKRRIIGVVLGSHSNSGSLYDPEETIVFEDMEKIINYSYKVKKEPIIKADSIVRTIPLKYRIFPVIGPVVSRLLKLQPKEDVLVYMHGGPLQISFTVPPVDIHKLNKKKSAGLLTIKQHENSYIFKLYPTISSNDILRWDFLPFYTILVSLGLISVFLIFFIKIVLRKKKKQIP